MFDKYSFYDVTINLCKLHCFFPLFLCSFNRNFLIVPTYSNPNWNRNFKLKQPQYGPALDFEETPVVQHQIQQEAHVSLKRIVLLV